MGQPLNRKRYVSRRKELSGRYSFLTSHSKTICPLWKKQNKNQVNSTKEVHNLCVPFHRNRTYLNSEWDPLLQKHLPVNVNDIIIRLLLLLSINFSWRMKVNRFYFRQRQLVVFSNESLSNRYSLVLLRTDRRLYNLPVWISKAKADSQTSPRPLHTQRCSRKDCPPRWCSRCFSSRDQTKKPISALKQYPVLLQGTRTKKSI